MAVTTSSVFVISDKALAFGELIFYLVCICFAILSVAKTKGWQRYVALSFFTQFNLAVVSTSTVVLIPENSLLWFFLVPVSFLLFIIVTLHIPPWRYGSILSSLNPPDKPQGIQLHWSGMAALFIVTTPLNTYTLAAMDKPIVPFSVVAAGLIISGVTVAVVLLARLYRSISTRKQK